MSNRIRFFLAHLSVSAIIAVIAICIVYFVWYPAPLGKALGVLHLFLMLIVIDVIVGPLFSLLVYKEGKKTLKFDLAVVILLQVCAFIYGFYHIAQGRPAWIVYGDRVFNLVKNSDIEQNGVERAKEAYKHVGYWGPEYVALDSNMSKSAQKELLAQTPMSNSAIRYPVNYTALEDAKLRMQYGALPMKMLEHYNEKTDVENVVEDYPSANAWIGLAAPAKDMVVLINKEKGEVVKIVDLRPWK